MIIRTPVIEFTDSWNMTWKVYQELTFPEHFGTDEQTVVSRTLLCFATDMVVRTLEPCPPDWWSLSRGELESLCGQAFPAEAFGGVA